MFEKAFARDLFHSTPIAAESDENIPYLVIFFVSNRNGLLFLQSAYLGKYSLIGAFSKPWKYDG